jgi:hypothetical protein
VNTSRVFPRWLDFSSAATILPTALRSTSQHLSQPQQSNLVLDDLLFGVHAQHLLSAPFRAFCQKMSDQVAANAVHCWSSDASKQKTPYPREAFNG